MSIDHQTHQFDSSSSSSSTLCSITMAAKQAPSGDDGAVDPRSGFCASTTTFHSKRNPVALPIPDAKLDITTFISSRRHSGTTALIDAATGRTVSYTQLWRSVSAVAAALSGARFSVRRGQFVLLLSLNSVHFPIVSLAVMSIGAVLTATNPLNTAAEISDQVAGSDPVLVFTTTEFLPKLQLLPQNLPVILLDDIAGDADRHLSIEDLIEEAAGDPVAAAVAQEDPAVVLYSSGTTGKSKGVVLTHRNLIAMVQIVINRFQFDRGRSPETFLCTVPMFHVLGIAAFATGLLASGSTIVILSRSRRIDDVMAAISRHGVTILPAVPPILVAMLNSGETPAAMGRLGTVMCGGATLGKEVVVGFRRRFPAVEVLQAYGMTESAAMGASTDTAEEGRRKGGAAAGMLSPNTEAKIVDPETGESMPVNRAGELWIRGPYVMKGYFKNPEATMATLTSDGWLRTGDLCYIDDDGYLFVVDRLKELIKYNGYQVAPAELEALLLGHPSISDAAVIGFPDEKVGQFPMAYVVRKEVAGSSLSREEIMDFVAQRVAPYKKIRRVAFVSEIPKNVSGKILRKDLVRLAAYAASAKL